MNNQDELRVTTFLAERLSITQKTKFYVEPEELQNSDTDTYIIDEFGVRTPIQNVTSEGEVLKNMNFNTKAFSRDEPFIAGEVNHLEWVQKALDGKEKKQYSNAKSLVLVLCNSMPTIPANQIKTLLQDVTNNFAGVYYVSTPNSSEDSGYVVALKKYWDTDDIF